MKFVLKNVFLALLLSHQLRTILLQKKYDLIKVKNSKYIVQNNFLSVKNEWIKYLFWFFMSTFTNEWMHQTQWIVDPMMHLRIDLIFHSIFSSLWFFSTQCRDNSGFHFVVASNCTKPLALTFASMDARLNRVSIAVQSAMRECEIWTNVDSRIYTRIHVHILP